MENTRVSPACTPYGAGHQEAATFVRPFIGHVRVSIFLIPLAKTLQFITAVDWSEELIKSIEMRKLLIVGY